MSYQLMYACSVTVAVLAAIIGAIQLANPEDLGIPLVVINWTKVIVPGLTVLAGVLPSLRRPPSDERTGMD